MKKYINLTFLAAVLLVMVGCSNSKNTIVQDSLKDTADSSLVSNESETQSEENQVNSADVKDMPAITAAESFGLYGNVKSMKTKDEIVNFNKIGNIESMKRLENGGSETVYYYENPYKYGFEEGDYPWIIKIEGNTRIDGRPDWDEYEEFEFDDKHRLVRHSFLIGMSPVTHNFTYSGNDRLPASLSYEYYDETGTDKVHVQYTYLDVDNHGNWLRRKGMISGTSTYYEGDENEKEVTKDIDQHEEIESRKIIYY